MTSDSIPLTAAMRFIAAPRFVTARSRIDPPALQHLIQLLFVCLVGVIVLSGVMGGIIASVRGSIPDNVNQTLGENDPRLLIAMGLVVAPILEELMFRSWLGGRRAAILGLPILASALTVLAMAGKELAPTLSFGLTIAFAVMILALARLYGTRSEAARDQARTRLFPLAFYGSAILFALLHLSNYDGGLSSPIMVLAVVPQGLVGLVLGYVRMRYGLLPAVLFHAAFNGFLIGLFFLGQSLSPPVDGAVSPDAILSFWLPLLGV